MSVVPNKQGRFGAYGGRYVPETLMPALLELEQEYARVKKDRSFQSATRLLLEAVRRTSYVAVLCATAHEEAGGGKDLFEA